MIHKEVKEIKGSIFERKATRAIILKDEKILLLYTERYNDYSFPGGGVDKEEDLIQGLKRELAEEVGAKNIKIINEFGYIDEYRPHYKKEYDLMHMESYFYICEIKGELERPKLEDYEIANGMKAVWINLEEAIKHNEKVIKENPKSMGLSIERETFALKLVRDRLVNKKYREREKAI